MQRITKFVLPLILVGLIAGCTNAASIPINSSGINHTSILIATSTPTPSLADISGRYYFALSRDNLVDLLPDGNAYIPEADFSVKHDTFAISGNQITFNGESCQDVAGLYKWSVSQTNLLLTLVDDSCTARSKILTQALTKLPQQYSFVNILWDKPVYQPDFN
jgi:sugar lactone lactonase YvrE